MSENIYTEKKWVVYLTIYSGDLLPRRYIGYTSQENFDKGYNGTVTSKDYKSIWLSERKNNIHLFKTRVIKQLDTEDEALIYEREIQTKYDVVKSDDYINMMIWPVFCKVDTSIAVIDPNGIVHKSRTDAAKVWGCGMPTIANWVKYKVGWSNVEGENISDEDKIKREDEWKEARSKQSKQRKGAKHPQADHTIRHWIHNESGETITGTRYELMEANPECNWDRGNLSAMINPNGNQKSHCGWSVVV